ncbi:uncharacterized protein BX664DRAFT_357822 [Halteromyces radiatus]|uniref:uncharacterized protein n=1 Tax=Halteromyces radiatus TaxID=101107 RepID=UPI00221F9D72|nr:uncharacterized protein BX664DRAFT_357822 [Halteromyces radiatus]KAI8093371.1 hypothetical protein BX664DRAFT_357822 [Halteromyces radiatus]
MTYTPYTLQTLLPAHIIEEILQSSSPDSSASASPPSLFTRRSTTPSSPTNNNIIASSPPSKLNARFNNLISSGNTPPKFTIDSVEAWGNDLYLGTSDGQILHFILEEQRNNSQFTGVPYVSKLQNKIFLGYGKKSVERILVIPQVSKAVVLCDSTLSFYSLPFFDPMPVSSIAPIKGVSSFTHDAAEEGRIGVDGTIELCVVKRRVMQIYKMGEFLQMKKEIPIHDGAIFVIRHSRSLCLADYQQYKLINIDPVNIIPLIPTPHEAVSPSLSSGMLSTTPQMVPKPVAAVVKTDEFLVVSGSASNQTIGIFLDALGNAIRGTMQWSSYPKSICVEYPYTAALLKNNTIEIHNLNNQQLLQVIHIDPNMEARGMSFGHGIKVHLDELTKRLHRSPYNTTPLSSSSLKESNDDELRSFLKREVARLSTVPARILVYGSNSVLAQIITPLVMQVDALIDDNHIEEAMEMTDQARNTMSPTNSIHVERMRSELDYIYQKCGLLMLKETVFEDAFTLMSKGNLDPRLVIQLFGERLISQSSDDSHPILLFDGIIDILENMKTIDDIVSSNMAKNYPDQKENSSSTIIEMRRVLLENAKEAVQKYLLAERGKRRDILGKGNYMCKAIDTALLKLFTTNNDTSMLYRILKEPNDCDLEECQQALLQSKRYYALSIFYQSKNMLEKSLDLWIEIYEGKKLDDDFKEGSGKMKQILLSNTDLPLPVFMRYTWWLMKENSTDGVEVMIRSPLAAEMDPGMILEKLVSFDTGATRAYLEYLVITRQSVVPEYHTQLACTYVKDVQQEIEKSGNASAELIKLVEDFKKSVDPLKPNMESETFVGYLGRLQHNESKLVQVRLALLRLLQQSQLYDANIVLKSLSEDSPLYIEKAIIFGRLGKHQRALDILIHELGDFVGAETYCATNGKSTGIIPI